MILFLQLIPTNTLSTISSHSQPQNQQQPELCHKIILYHTMQVDLPSETPVVLHSPTDPSQSDAESDGVHSQSAQTEHSHGLRTES